MHWVNAVPRQPNDAQRIKAGRLMFLATGEAEEEEQTLKSKS